MSARRTSPPSQCVNTVSPEVDLRGGGLAGLFSTHPPIEERVARLRGTS